MRRSHAELDFMVHAERDAERDQAKGSVSDDLHRR